MRSEQSESFAPLAREIHQKLCAEQPPAETTASTEADPERRELYALLSVASDVAVDNFLQRSSAIEPLGLVKDWSRSPVMGPDYEPVLPATLRRAPDPYLELHRSLMDTAIATRFPTFSGEHSQTEMGAILDRIAEIGPGLSLLEQQHKERYAETLLQRGLVNMFETGVALLEVIERLVHRDSPRATAADIAAVARYSRPEVSEFSTYGFDEFLTVMYDVTNSRPEGFRHFSIEAFSLEETSRGKRLVIPPRPAEAVKLFTLINKKRLGCPAMVRLVEVSAIEKMWGRLVRTSEESIWQTETEQL